jgi:hypothetical protein
MGEIKVFIPFLICVGGFTIILFLWNVLVAPYRIVRARENENKIQIKNLTQRLSKLENKNISPTRIEFEEGRKEMSVYICEDYAEKHNVLWKHAEECLLCKVIKELEYLKLYYCDECYYIDPEERDDC